MALIDLLFLIVLAAMAHQSKRPLLAGILFGVLKAVSFYFVQLSEMDVSLEKALSAAAFHYVINAILGAAIGYIVVKHSTNVWMMILMLFLSILSFLTHIVSDQVMNLLQ